MKNIFKKTKTLPVSVMSPANDKRFPKIHNDTLSTTKTFLRGQGCSRVQGIDIQQKLGSRGFTIEDFISFYESISPVADAIDLIAQQYSSISPRIWDTRNKEYISDHPFLDLLKNPNTTVDYLEFAEQQMTFFELTGNCFWVATTSRLDGEPIQLECVPPQWISPTIGSDGYVDIFLYTPILSGNTKQFKRMMVGNSWRYLSADGTQEMFQLKRFNPDSGGFRIYGLPKLRALAYQMLHFRDACLHNISLLQNSATPSGMLTSTSDYTLTPDQLNDLKAELDNVFIGAANAGRPMVTQNLDWKPFSMTNKEMDYIEARSQLKEEIYNRLKIPLALINSNALSLANMTVAERQLYNLAILPAADKIFSTLTMHLMPRYKGSENYILTYDPYTIPALREQALQDLTQMAAFNVMSDNEIRKRMDIAEIKNDQANQIYKPSTLIPNYPNVQ